MKKETLLANGAGALLAALPLLAAAGAPSLPGLGADLSQTSVSGISSGAFMAAQLATAYSAMFMGVGVIAGGPYYCAGTYDSLPPAQNAITTCMQPAKGGPAADALISLRAARRFAAEGKIDPVSNLARQRVYIYSGAADHIVHTVVVDQVKKYYQLAGVPDSAILYEKGAAGHSIITDKSADTECAVTKEPYINNCKFMQSEKLLHHIYGANSKPSSKAALTGEILKFDQAEFIKGKRSSMDDDAYVYIPAYCKANTCIVHVAFHGCLQGASRVGEKFYNGTGYNEYADTNRMIVLYPQASISNGIPPNPLGCWDYWGYSSDNQNELTYYNRAAPQMTAVLAMLERLGQARARQP